jgi:hypothetical protein
MNRLARKQPGDVVPRFPNLFEALLEFCSGGAVDDALIAGKRRSLRLPLRASRIPGAKPRAEAS